MSDNPKKKIAFQNSERRIAFRHSLVRFVWFKPCDKELAEHEGVEGVCSSCDLSTSGIGIFMTKPLAIGTRIFLEITLDEFNLSAVGKIVYSKKIREGYFRVGIEFVVVPPNDRFLLEKIFGENG